MIVLGYPRSAHGGDTTSIFMCVLRVRPTAPNASRNHPPARVMDAATRSTPGLRKPLCILQRLVRSQDTTSPSRACQKSAVQWRRHRDHSWIFDEELKAGPRKP
jgi:hypothetical protein